MEEITDLVWGKKKDKGKFGFTEYPFHQKDLFFFPPFPVLSDHEIQILVNKKSFDIQNRLPQAI